MMFNILFLLYISEKTFINSFYLNIFRLRGCLKDMVEGKEGFSRKNLIDLMFIFVFAIFIVFLLSSVVAQIASVFNAGGTNYTDYNLVDRLYGGKFNEDTGYIYNITINHTGGVAGENITNVTIFFWGAFVFNDDYFGGTVADSQGNATWNVTNVKNAATGDGDVFAGATFYSLNTSGGFVGWNGTNLTSYILSGNRTVIVNNTFFWFNATAPNPGKFNMTVTMCYNWGASCQRSNISVTINDTTAPENITFSSTNLLNNSNIVNHSVGNFSGNLLLNISTSDNGGAVRSVFFNITANNTREGNGTGWFYAATNASTSPNWWTYTLNTHNLPDGFYNITVWVNDSNGNLNITRSVNITVDNTAPTGTMECSPIDAYVGGIVTCTCSSTDNLVGVTSAGNIYTASPATSSSGTGITQTCTFTDLAGNAGSATSNTYNVWGTTVDGGNGGSGGSSTTTKPVTATTSFGEITPSNPVTMTNFVSDSGVKEIKVEVSQAASGVKLTVNKYESAPSAVSSKSGTYKYLNIETQNLGTSLSKATMKIQVEKSWVSNKGITKEDITLFKYDETGKKWNELTTIFNSEDATYYYYTVELSSFSYFAIAAKEGVTVEEEEEETTTPPAEETKGAMPSYWIWIIIGVIVLAIIIGLGIKLKKKK